MIVIVKTIALIMWGITLFKGTQLDQINALLFCVWLEVAHNKK